MNTITRAVIIFVLFFLGACGSGTPGGDTGGKDGNGTFTLNLTDAPIDQANKVVVEFVGAELRGGDLTESMVFDFAPKTIDLLDLQGVSTATLIDNQPVPAGTYDELRLKVNVVEDGELESYIELTDGSQHELIIPSGAQSGLKIKRDIVILDGEAKVFTVDFDVRRSIVVAGRVDTPRVKFHLKPVLRLVDSRDSGDIIGQIDPALLTAPICPDPDPLINNNAVYVYTGADVVPDDIDNGDDTNIEPLTTTLVSDSGQYVVGFLDAGDYTVAFTCNAGDENADRDDDLQFAGTRNVKVVEGLVVTADLGP
jgi:hypothetical protein